MINTIPENNENSKFSPKTADGSLDPLLIGTISLEIDIDPVFADDRESDAVIDQISEGLFAYTLINRNLTIIPRLASNYGSWNFDNTEFTVPLRENVFFHNGHAFNATAVKNSFDRLNHLMDLNKTSTEDLYRPLNNELVINSIVVINEFTVKFVLNYSYAAFEALLCFGSSYIVDTSVMPADDILDPTSILIGTGPYKHMGNDGTKVYFEYFPSYYRGIPAVKYIQYIKYNFTTEIMEALLAGEINVPHNLDLDYLDDLKNSDIVIVENPEVDAIISYLGMNNNNINRNMRQAISYAIDYNNINSEIYSSDPKTRMKSFLSPAINYYKECNVATLDIGHARQILIDAGLSKGLDEYSSNSEWIALSGSGDPVADYYYTYNAGNFFRENLGIQLQSDLSQIGISVVMENITWSEFMFKLVYNPDELDLYYLGWTPNYNDPTQLIDVHFSNNSQNNFLQVNDPWLQQKIYEGLNETDKSARQQIYYDIQDYLATDLMPMAFIGYNNIQIAYGKNVKYIPSNALEKKYYFYCTWWGATSIVIDSYVDVLNVDSDRDGLLNSEEENTYGSDPFDTDSDDDGLLDGEEVYDYGTDPMNTDSDYDGLLDGEEVFNYGTDPADSDSDNDGLLDGEEINVYETDPLDADSDNDDYDDGYEIESGTDPLDPDSFPDKNPFMYFLNIPGYPSIIVSICLISTIALLIWRSKRSKITFLRA